MSFTAAIGDVHGRADVLERAFRQIRIRLGKPHIILLGDYVDRGSQSREVVEFLSKSEPSKLTSLRGNHENIMVSACRNPVSEHGRLWLQSGGVNTLRSYGAERPSLADFSRVPQAHLDWMSQLPFIHEDAHRIYVHAGIDLDRPTNQQREDTCLWIRKGFLDADPALFPAKHIVHGHTPHTKPELLPHRTNLDTGAYLTDVLTVGIFDDDLPGGPIDVWSIM